MSSLAASSPQLAIYARNSCDTSVATTATQGRFAGPIRTLPGASRPLRVARLQATSTFSTPRRVRPAAHQSPCRGDRHARQRGAPCRPAPLSCAGTSSCAVQPSGSRATAVDVDIDVDQFFPACIVDAAVGRVTYRHSRQPTALPICRDSVRPWPPIPFASPQSKRGRILAMPSRISSSL